MNLGALEKFAKEARVSLMRMVGDKIERALLSESPARRENRRAVEELERVIKVRGQESVVEEAAYHLKLVDIALVISLLPVLAHALSRTEFKGCGQYGKVLPTPRNI